MNIETPSYRGSRGFTLHEMVGVLAAIAILVSIVSPKTLRLLDDARLAADVNSIEALRGAADAYFEQYGKFAGPNGAAVASWSYNAHESWDRTTLLTEGLIEAALRSQLATNAFARLVKVTTTNPSEILSSIGQVGSISGFNGNNGYYNLTQDYACADDTLPGGSLLARGGLRQPAWNGALRWLAARSLARAAVTMAPLAIWSFPAEVRGGPRPSGRWLHFVGPLVRFVRAGGNPIECCYPVPANWPLPPSAIGTSTGGGRYNNPDARTQIVAPRSGHPAIVVEVVLQGVTVENAYRLSLTIDGPRQSNWAFFDSLGRVKYDMYDSYGGASRGTVFVYLAHK